MGLVQRPKKQNPELDKIQNGKNPECTKSKMGQKSPKGQNPILDKTTNEQNPELDKVTNGQNSEWTKSDMEKIPN